MSAPESQIKSADTSANSQSATTPVDTTTATTAIGSSTKTVPEADTYNDDSDDSDDDIDETPEQQAARIAAENAAMDDEMFGPEDEFLAAVEQRKADGNDDKDGRGFFQNVSRAPRLAGLGDDFGTTRNKGIKDAGSLSKSAFPRPPASGSVKGTKLLKNANGNSDSSSQEQHAPL